MTYLMICTDFFVIESSWFISIYRYNDKTAADTDPCLSILGHVVQGSRRVQEKNNKKHVESTSEVGITHQHVVFFSMPCVFTGQ